MPKTKFYQRIVLMLIKLINQLINLQAKSVFKYYNSVEKKTSRNKQNKEKKSI